MAHAENRVAVENARVVEVDIARPERMRADRDDEGVGGQHGRFGVGAGAHFDRVGVGKTGVAVLQPDPVAQVKILAHGGLAGDDRLRRAQQFGVRQPWRGTERAAKRRAGVEFQHPVDRVTQGLGRNGAPVGAAAADRVMPFDDRDRFALLGGFHGGSLASRTGADHDNIIVRIVHCSRH